MTKTIGHIEAIFRYPVKSMRGESLETATLGFHGIEGDRRFAFRRREERGGFPWLTAGKLPDLIRFTPVRREAEADAPSHVVTPEGEELPLFSEALAAEVGRRHGAPVEMMQMKHGIFDDASLSVITSDTVDEVCRLAGQEGEVRRFRPNVLVRSATGIPFEEDTWVGGTLSFGEAADAPTLGVTLHDIRCAMVNLNPEGGSAPEVMKAVVRANQNKAGIYGTVTRGGRLEVGQPVVLRTL